MSKVHLLSFFHQLLISPSFHILIIFFENSTVDSLDHLTDALRVHPNHDVVLFNVDRNTDGVDLMKSYFTHSIVVELYEDHDARKLRWPRQKISQFNLDFKLVRIYLNQMKTPRFYNTNRNRVIVKVLESSLHVEAFNFNYSKVVNITVDNEDGNLFKELFFDWTIDYGGERLFMWGGMDAPNQFNAKSFHNGAEIRGLCGIYAFISQIIGRHFNASVVFGLPNQETWMNSMSKPYRRYEQLKSRIYQTDFVIPQVEKLKWKNS